VRFVDWKSIFSLESVMRDARRLRQGLRRFLTYCMCKSLVKRWKTISSCLEYSYQLKNHKCYLTKRKLSNAEAFERGQGASHWYDLSRSAKTSSCTTFWLHCADDPSSVVPF